MAANGNFLAANGRFFVTKDFFACTKGSSTSARRANRRTASRPPTPEASTSPSPLTPARLSCLAMQASHASDRLALFLYNWPGRGCTPCPLPIINYISSNRPPQLATTAQFIKTKASFMKTTAAIIGTPPLLPLSGAASGQPAASPSLSQRRAGPATLPSALRTGTFPHAAACR